MRYARVFLLLLLAASAGWAQQVSRMSSGVATSTSGSPKSFACADALKLQVINSASAYSAVLPVASSCDAGTVFSFKNIGAGLLTITVNSSGTIDGGTTGAFVYSGQGMDIFDSGSVYNSQPGGALGIVPTVVDTATPVTVSTTNLSEFHFNQHATVGTAITYNLPTAAAGKQFCFSNSYGSGTNTGVLTLQTSASGQYIIYTDGTLSASNGYVSSGGAAADAACVVGVDATHWMLYTIRGAWAKH